MRLFCKSCSITLGLNFRWIGLDTTQIVQSSQLWVIRTTDMNFFRYVGRFRRLSLSILRSYIIQNEKDGSLWSIILLFSNFFRYFWHSGRFRLLLLRSIRNARNLICAIVDSENRDLQIFTWYGVFLDACIFYFQVLHSIKAVNCADLDH